MEEQLNVLPCEEAKESEITLEQYKHLCECKDNALKIAEDTQEKLRMQLNKQVEMYNHDMNYMSELNRNSVNYTRAKEDAIIKILEGITSLITLDRMPIVPDNLKEEK